MSIYTSRTSGLTWDHLYQLGNASLAGGYSSLAVVNSSHVSVAYEGSHLKQSVLAFEIIALR
eukprot:COSAG01_NODE_10397_length_2176_cov_89.025518_1_plen_62_part_00